MQYVNIKQAAELLGSDRNFIKRHLSKGTIKAIISSTPTYKISVEELEKLKGYKRK